MKNVVVEELRKELNWRERIVLKIFRKTIVKVYNIIRINTINTMLK